MNRLRATLLEYFPALERAFDYYSKKAPLILLGGYQTPAAIRRAGSTRLAGWLKKRGCRNSTAMAEKALEAANAQHTVLHAQSTGSALVARLTEQINLSMQRSLTSMPRSPICSGSTKAPTCCSACPGSGPCLR
jgi:alpha-beta hydrolase superfamily lysophospholipase